MKQIPVRSIHSTQRNSKFAESFSIRDVHELLGGKDLVQETHRHDFFFILLLKKGKGTHVIDFISHKIADRSVFFLRPGQVHQLTLKAGSQGFLLEFKKDFYYPHDKLAHQLLRTASHKNLCQPDATPFKKLLDILTSIFQEYTSQQEMYEDVITSRLGIFFIELVRSRKNQNTSAKVVNSYAQERLDQFFELLETNIFHQKQISFYADALSLSPYQLNAITKEVLGKTSSELITEQIILESKRNLLATSNQVSQIAYQLGYEDVSYFIRFFRKHTGYSPEAFRRTFR